MTHTWPWWAGGLALASIVFGHWLLMGRQLAVSGRFTALVNRLRFGPSAPSLESANQQALLAAIQQATLAEFGEADTAPDTPPTSPTVEASSPPALGKPRPSTQEHLLFLGSLALGGLGARLLGTTGSEPATTFDTLFGGHVWLAPVALLLGGALVGFGTRMAAGCTSGHGLCGVSRLQPGSLLATAVFFGAGIATAFALGALL